MGKGDKKQKHHDRHSRRRDFKFTSEGEVMEDGDFNSHPLPQEEEQEVEVEEEEQETSNEASSMDIPSKFQLYQQSVQVWLFFFYCNSNPPMGMWKIMCIFGRNDHFRAYINSPYELMSCIFFVDC